MRKLALVATVCGSLVAVAALPSAAGAVDSRQSASLKFTQKAPGKPSGLVLRIDYVNPDDPAGKPPAVRRVVTELAPGARYDTGAPQACTASDLELTLLGPSACPAGSRVGEGQLTLDTGLPAPVRFLDIGIDFLNAPRQLIYLNQPAPLDIPRVVLRSPIGERTVTTDAPFLPGTLPDGAAIDTVFVRDFVTTRTVDGALRSYITTPRRCPLVGYWLNRVHFTYHDGVKQTVATRSRCVPA